MVSNLNSLIKQTFKSSGIVVSLGIIIFFLIKSKYWYIFAIGAAVGISNLFLSAQIIKHITKENVNYKGFILAVSFVIRISLVALIGLLLVLQNQHNLIPYIIGFTSNFISLFMAIKYLEERK